MPNALINQQLVAIRTKAEEAVKGLHELTLEIGHEALASTLSDLRNRMHDPFMFVIVGEVKAGKSSFINALLATGREITKVAPQPMTDTIQQITYGEEEQIITVNPFLKKILLPVEILQEIAIVDTPGTNTIVDHHQEITEEFIPASDLIVFVFEAKNPYRQSAWEFFDYIHADWRKKIIFVLQQKDLMTENDLQVNFNGVKEHAEKKGIATPNVFAVSAKQEQEGDQENSGFKAIRNYISDNITGGQAPKLKLQNNISTSQNIHERIAQGLSLRRRQYEADLDFRKDIRETLEHQATKSNKQVDVLVENLIAAYDRSTLEKEKELRQGLGFFSLLRRSIAGIFSKQTSAKDWLEGLAKNLENDLTNQLRERLDSGVGDLADSIQQMAKMIDLKIRNSETILKNDHDLFSDIADRRASVMQELQQAFSSFLRQSENFTDDELFPDKETLSPNLAAGGGIAAIGIILTAMANLPMLDITGGIMTTVGLLFAGVTTRAKRNKILEGYTSEIAKGRTRLEGEVTERLKTYIDSLKEKFDDNFDRFDELLEKENEQLTKLEEKHQTIGDQLAAMESELG